nr:hypothetical protein [Tannerella forsythia]
MKKTIFSILGYLFFIQFLSAQITTNEAPFSFGSTPSQLLRSISTQELSAPDMAIIRAEDKVNDTPPLIQPNAKRWGKSNLLAEGCKPDIKY